VLVPLRTDADLELLRAHRDRHDISRAAQAARDRERRRRGAEAAGDSSDEPPEAEPGPSNTVVTPLELWAVRYEHEHEHEHERRWEQAQSPPQDWLSQSATPTRAVPPLQ
jgi:hypothetical protein